MAAIIGERLYELRKSNKKMTQDKLAKLVFISKQVISNMERGVTSTINSHNLNLIAYHLKTNVKYLSGESDDPTVIDIIDPNDINFIEFGNILSAGPRILNADSIGILKHLFQTDNLDDIKIISIVLDLLRNDINKNLLIDILESFKKNI